MSILYNMGRKMVAILHIYGAIAILLLFCDHQDTESESCKMEIGVAGTISTWKKISKDIWDNEIHTLQYGRKILW